MRRIHVVIFSVFTVISTNLFAYPGKSSSSSDDDSRSKKKSVLPYIYAHKSSSSSSSSSSSDSDFEEKADAILHQNLKPKFFLSESILPHVPMPNALDDNSLVPLIEIFHNFNSIEILIVIDMQIGFIRDSVESDVIYELKEAMKGNRLILFVEYASSGSTIDSLLSTTSKYARKCVIRKKLDSGMLEIATLLKKVGISHTKEIRICGVQTGECVRSTAQDLCFVLNEKSRYQSFAKEKAQALEQLDIERVTVVGSACRHYRSLDLSKKILKEMSLSKDKYPKLFIEEESDDEDPYDDF